jgi:hypothetical protein
VSKFVVVVGEPTLLVTAGGTVLDGSRTDPAGKTVTVVHFTDDAQAVTASLVVGGTLFGSEWAAREHARHKASGDERAWDDADAFEKIV